MSNNNNNKSPISWKARFQAEKQSELCTYKEWSAVFCKTKVMYHQSTFCFTMNKDKYEAEDLKHV